ncbi:MAG: TonB-dependent receptor plug domain-containing protein [Saprospiraceae bacterium]
MKFVFVCLLMIISFPSFSQFTLQGKAVNKAGFPITGVSVEWIENKQVEITDDAGYFRFECSSSRLQSLVFNHLSYVTRRVEMAPEIETVVFVVLDENAQILPELQINGSWVKDKTPITYQTLKKSDFEHSNLGQDLPYLLQQTPSVVVSSDAGTGFGYTGLRIRGSDQTRINTTINGIPLNEAESHSVFWVDLPDFASSAQAIQIQRGVGTSANGAGAFGASINLSTLEVREDPYVEINASGGSFQSSRFSASVGTGLLGKHLYFDGRISRIQSNGYIDRANANLNAYYASALWMNENTSFRFITFSGHERTYQAWNGVPVQYLTNDKTRTFNTAGLRSDRSFYQDEVDDYGQSHYQLHINHRIGQTISLHLAMHYTKGGGYYEQFREQDDLEDYGFTPIPIGDTLISTADIVRRKWLQTDLFGGIYQINYHPVGSRHNVTLGGGLNRYIGSHFGQVVVGQYIQIRDENERYYDQKAYKTDWNTYLQWRYDLDSKSGLFADLQLRKIRYDFALDRSVNTEGQIFDGLFFNPKLGYYNQLSQNWSSYMSIGIAQREPNREDFTESSLGSRPKSEWLLNPELGVKGQIGKFALNVNLFWMHYRDQLALSGKLNDVGAYTRINIPLSNRYGLEAQVDYQSGNWFGLNFSGALSQNKVKAFTEYIDNWESGEQRSVEHMNTDLAFSPNLILQSTLTLATQIGHSRVIYLDIIGRYISSQYLDNTSNENSKLEDYGVLDARIRFSPKWKFAKSLDFILQANNVLDKSYISNAWIYRFDSPGYNPVFDDPYVRQEDGDTYQQSGWFPQAGLQLLGGITLKF